MKETVRNVNSKLGQTIEGQDKICIALATNQAEQMLREGKAPSQIVTHYLQMASPIEQLKRRRLEKEIELMDAKIKTLQSMDSAEERYIAAVEAMKSYKGSES